MTSWHLHGKIYNLGHSAVADLLKGNVVVQEKVDGSQFSFGVYDGVLKVRSKGQELNVDAPEKMFALAVDTVKNIRPLLIDGYMYRAEYLQKPKHNSLAYDRVPTNHVILFDVCTAEETYLRPADVAAEASRLGLEAVPSYFEGVGAEVTEQTIQTFLSTTSVLGGQKVEGVVIKNYARFHEDGKAVMGKYVSEAFKEVHKGDWRERHPTGADFIEALANRYRTPARWDKAVQHLKEAGRLEGSPKDIGALMGEVKSDVKLECEDEIKRALFAHAWDKVERAIVRGLPDWYKAKLLAEQFKEKA